MIIYTPILGYNTYAIMCSTVCLRCLSVSVFLCGWLRCLVTRFGEPTPAPCLKLHGCDGAPKTEQDAENTATRHQPKIQPQFNVVTQSLTRHGSLAHVMFLKRPHLWKWGGMVGICIASGTCDNLRGVVQHHGHPREDRTGLFWVNNSEWDHIPSTLD